MRTFSTTISYFNNSFNIDPSLSHYDLNRGFQVLQAAEMLSDVLELNDGQKELVTDICVDYMNPQLTSFRLLSERSTPSDYRKVIEFRRFLRNLPGNSGDSFFLANLNSGECMLITSYIS